MQNNEPLRYPHDDYKYHGHRKSYTNEIDIQGASLLIKNNNNLLVEKNSSLDYIKTLILNSLPHLAILILFLTYSLIGAAIFKEIETDNLIEDSLLYKANGHLNHNLKRYEPKKKQQEYKLNTVQIKSSFKEHKTKVTSNWNKIILKLNEEAMQNSTHLHVEIDTLEFIDTLKLKSLNQKQATINHLVEYKLKSNLEIQQNLRKAFDEYSNEQKNFEKKINDLIQKQDNIFKSQFNENNREEPVVIEQSCVEADCEAKKVEKKKFLTSFHFIIASLTSIGYKGLIPQSILGKLFTMVYLFIGLPLTYSSLRHWEAYDTLS